MFWARVGKHKNKGVYMHTSPCACAYKFRSQAHGLGEFGIRKTIFYKPMGLCVFVLRVFHIIIRFICENNDHFGIFVSLGVQGADDRENTHTSG